MFCGTINSKIRRNRNIKQIIFLLLMVAIITTASACSAPKGSILIVENVDGTGFTMDFKDWSSNNKCELSLNKGDVLQIEIDREDGKISLRISGKNGSEPYEGNNLESGLFTVKVPERDAYAICITGKNATGKVMVKIVE